MVEETVTYSQRASLNETNVSLRLWSMQFTLETVSLSISLLSSCLKRLLPKEMGDMEASEAGELGGLLPIVGFQTPM